MGRYLARCGLRMSTGVYTPVLVECPTVHAAAFRPFLAKSPPIDLIDAKRLLRAGSESFQVSFLANFEERTRITGKPPLHVPSPGPRRNPDQPPSHAMRRQPLRPSRNSQFRGALLGPLPDDSCFRIMRLGDIDQFRQRVMPARNCHGARLRNRVQFVSIRSLFAGLPNLPRRQWGRDLHLP